MVKLVSRFGSSSLIFRIGVGSVPKPFERAKDESFDIFMWDGESTNPFGGCTFSGQVHVNN